MANVYFTHACFVANPQAQLCNSQCFECWQVSNNQCPQDSPSLSLSQEELGALHLFEEQFPVILWPWSQDAICSLRCTLHGAWAGLTDLVPPDRLNHVHSVRDETDRVKKFSLKQLQLVWTMQTFFVLSNQTLLTWSERPGNPNHVSISVYGWGNNG